VLFWASWSIIRSSLRVLLQGTPEHFDLEAAMETLRGIEGVDDVHHVHAWSITSGRDVFSAHVRVADYARDGERVLKEASDHLKHHFGVYFSTIQVEERCLSSEAGAEAIDITARSE